MDAANTFTGNEEGTRDALVAAALELFAHEGIGSVSIRRVTAAAGASNQSAVHYYFENKLGLVRAVLDKVNAQLAPLQQEAREELAAIRKQRVPTVYEIVGIGLSPYVHMFTYGPEGATCMRFLSRLTWESGREAQELMLQKVRPYFLELLPLLQEVLPQKSLEVLDLQLFMAASSVIHGLADLDLLRREPDSSVDRMLADRPHIALQHLYEYVAGGLASPQG
jgi:AcrR family transcriptional regulator